MCKTYQDAIAELATTVWLEYNTDARLAIELVAFIYNKSIEEVQQSITEFLNR